MDIKRYNYLRATALKAAFAAAEKIMKIYGGDFVTEIKDDGSPVTTADTIANTLIVNLLGQTGLPVLSEESSIPGFSIRRSWKYYWLVDPLDGTREFMAGNGEFTVNIALIKESQPVMGVVLAPALQKAWYGSFIDNTSWIDGQEFWEASQRDDPWDVFENAFPGQGTKENKKHIIAVSRSHVDDKTSEIIRQINLKYNGSSLIKKGSSLKFCDLAEGTATIYPRYASISEWDTAAGHALLNAAGGGVFDIVTEREMQYNGETLKNPPFVAFANKSEADRFFSEIS